MSSLSRNRSSWTQFSTADRNVECCRTLRLRGARYETIPSSRVPFGRRRRSSNEDTGADPRVRAWILRRRERWERAEKRGAEETGARRAFIHDFRATQIPTQFTHTDASARTKPEYYKYSGEARDRSDFILKWASLVVSVRDRERHIDDLYFSLF